MIIKLIYIFPAVLLMCSCVQKSSSEKHSENESTTKDSTIKTVIDYGDLEVNDHEVFQELSINFTHAQHYQLTDTIVADFNGDGNVDRAVFKAENNKSGIIISEGNSENVQKIGLGTSFGEMGDDFSWADYWGLMEDSTTYEVLVVDGEIVGDTTVKLYHPSIVLRKEEAGGGIITYREGQYVWVHQSD